MSKKYHVQMKVYDDDGNMVNMLPIADASDIVISTDETKIPETATSLQDVLNALGALAFKDSIDPASISEAGVVELSNVTNDTTCETKAATTKAVSSVNENVVHIVSDETVEGVKTFTDGIDINGAGTLTGEVDASGNKTVILTF